jgi:hypothetical protein
MQEPTTPDDWRRAVTLAEVMLDIDAARQYGLITGGPEVNVARCVDVLRRGRQRGIVPRSPDVNAMTEALVRELCDRR